LGFGAKVALKKHEESGEDAKQDDVVVDTSTPSDPATSSTPSEKTLTNGSALKNDMANLKVSDAAVPHVKTVPGPPEGDVVFDHPPSHSEKEQARASIEASRKSLEVAK
jgi:hypothetical protein